MIDLAIYVNGVFSSSVPFNKHSCIFAQERILRLVVVWLRERCVVARFDFFIIQIHILYDFFATKNRVLVLTFTQKLAVIIKVGFFTFLLEDTHLADRL